VSQTSSRAAARIAVLPSRNAAAVTVHLRRLYVDCRYGQLHVHSAFPSSGGFDELTPLVCLAPPPMSGGLFKPFLAEMGRDRSVYAPDAPGCGESDAPQAAPSVHDYAQAFGDLLDTLRLRQVDVLGYQFGALPAAELAIARPEQVRRVVLIGVPVFDTRDREGFASRPWPARPREDGSHLLEEWQRIRRVRGPGASLARLSSDLGCGLRAGDEATWGPAAAAHYAAGERLPLLRQPVLVLRPHDEYWEMTARSEPLLRDARRIDMPECDGSLFDTRSNDLARDVSAFLDR
jgi:pimeloyl-ACP methyl ester carboxylesterase